ncbi:MAG: hypothetical protein IK012_03870 [Fibrobacter sp.]|uniref:hypothetical protein n=1 Tax=Fibrobacter sp. TaxID=35828 RepID=UPI0025C66348|nr:hypothetical protein [Fibrobacter sp.]MBR4784375.1 hypothetical protein [Fibrobacter sp.]
MKKFFSLSFLALIFAAHAYAWDMGAYVENDRAAKGIKDSTFIWKDKQEQPEAVADSSMALTSEQLKQLTNDINYHARRGFYFSIGFSIGIASLSNTENDWHNKKTIHTFSGQSLPYNENRFGYYFANRISIYGAFGLGIGYGTFESSSNDKKETNADVMSMRSLLGLGAEIYPFQDKESNLYGLYLGLCVGGAVQKVQEHKKGNYLIDYTYYFNNPSIDSFSNTFARIEVGYDYWFNRRWKTGFVFSYAFGKYDSDDDDNLITTSHNFDFTIRIAR